MSNIDILQTIRIIDIPFYIGHNAKAHENVNGDNEEKVSFHREGANITRNLNRDLADFDRDLADFWINRKGSWPFKGNQM